MSDSERIIKLKNFLDKSYNRVAEECGINNAQTLYDIKNGKHGISKDIADKISSRYLNISKQWLLTGEGEMLLSTPSAPVNWNTEAIPGISELIATVRKQADIIMSQQETINELAKRLARNPK